MNEQVADKVYPAPCLRLVYQAAQLPHHGLVFITRQCEFY
jgi:hypothetical protein